MEELQGWYQLGCAISKCVLRASLKQECPAVPCHSTVALLESQLSHNLQFIFVPAGIIPALSCEATARQGSVAQLREAPMPYSAQQQVLPQAVIARKTLIPNASTPRTNVALLVELPWRCVGRLLLLAGPVQLVVLCRTECFNVMGDPCEVR